MFDQLKSNSAIYASLSQLCRHVSLSYNA